MAAGVGSSVSFFSNVAVDTLPALPVGRLPSMFMQATLLKLSGSHRERDRKVE